LTQQIQTPQHAEALRAEFKLRFPQGLVLGDTIVPIIITSDLTGGGFPSLAYPRECMGFVSQAAGGAGTIAQNIAVSNPGRGLLYVLTLALVNKPAAGEVSMRVSQGGGAIAGQTEVDSKSYLDQRHGSTVPDMQIAREAPLTAAADGNEVGRVQFSAADTIAVPLNVILGGDEFFLFASNTENELLRTTFYWTEFLLEDR